MKENLKRFFFEALLSMVGVKNIGHAIQGCFEEKLTNVLVMSKKSISCVDSAAIIAFTSRSVVFLQSRPGLIEMKFAILII